MRLDEQELQMLINRSNEKDILSLKYGPGWVKLLNIEQNKWAINIINKTRKKPQPLADQGAG